MCTSWSLVRSLLLRFAYRTKVDTHCFVRAEGVELPTWKVAKCEQAPLPREWHRAVVHDDAMYVFGGHTSEGNENKLYKLASKPAASA